MVTEWLIILEKGIWFGLAAIGFAVLFNVPPRSLFLIWLLAAIGGMTRLVMLHYNGNIILGSFVGAAIIGFLSIQAAHIKHTPPIIFSIPAVIPMVPGVLAYRTMLGFINLASAPKGTPLQQVLIDTTNNGLNMIFILMALAVGVSVPMLISRRDTIKHMKFGMKAGSNYKGR
jgi:uncharacterized membrane protein YjjB (DUF3815 family)